MNQKIDIAIKKPCSENFNNFLPTDKGGFCNACNKEVIDFSKMNDKEIINYFNSTDKKTCGSFRQDQLKMYSLPNESLWNNKFNFWNKGFVGFSLVSLLSFNNGFAQEKKTNSKTEINQKIETEKSDIINQSDKIIVKGTVSDELGPLAGASVVIKNTAKGVTTDFDGNFEFPEPIDKDAIVIVSFVGLKKVEIKASEVSQINLETSFDSCDLIFIGEVTTSKIHKSKRTFFQKITGLFKND
ncbi:carboxypeptidase-like regulatory domain-containing protein [Flavobacterium ponti]|uniref:Carboxypeptidase-like regulatory domain-containing protein n=1 Tax=Flavobacterium ponti TaxID=665133 RepID=A0ABV9P7F5_9FLAO